MVSFFIALFISKYVDTLCNLVLVFFTDHVKHPSKQENLMTFHQEKEVYINVCVVSRKTVQCVYRLHH